MIKNILDFILSFLNLKLINIFQWKSHQCNYGGSGTTAIAALGGKPQIVIPHTYDQFYWAGRVQKPGIGYSVKPGGALTADSALSMLEKSLDPEIIRTAGDLTNKIEMHGAKKAAEKMISVYNKLWEDFLADLSVTF